MKVLPCLSEMSQTPRCEPCTWFHTRWLGRAPGGDTRSGTCTGYCHIPLVCVPAPRTEPDGFDQSFQRAQKPGRNSFFVPLQPAALRAAGLLMRRGGKERQPSAGSSRLAQVGLGGPIICPPGLPSCTRRSRGGSAGGLHHTQTLHPAGASPRVAWAHPCFGVAGRRGLEVGREEMQEGFGSENASSNCSWSPALYRCSPLLQEHIVGTHRRVHPRLDSRSPLVFPRPFDCRAVKANSITTSGTTECGFSVNTFYSRRQLGAAAAECRFPLRRCESPPRSPSVAHLPGPPAPGDGPATQGQLVCALMAWAGVSEMVQVGLRGGRTRCFFASSLPHAWVRGAGLMHLLVPAVQRVSVPRG